jgi:nitronate monooxygenase
MQMLSLLLPFLKPAGSVSCSLSLHLPPLPPIFICKLRRTHSPIPGFINAGFDFSPASAQLQTLSAELTQARDILKLAPNAPLPLGAGFIMLRPANFLSAVLPIMQKHKIAAIWLFGAPDRECYAEIIPAIKAAGADWGVKVFVQVGTVQAAREAVEVGTDVLVCQGVDAGGHQFVHGTSFVTLVPEVVDCLAAEFGEREVCVLATGGIMDGRGTAAALMLG